MNPIPPDPKTVITEVKSLRQIITINAGSLQKLPKTRETSLALTKLEEGCMWLGKELQRIGDLFPDLLKDPYPTSKDPSVGTIDPPEPEVSSPPKDNRPDWLVRLVEERDQLLERITKLARFLSKQKGGATIDTQKLRLLKDQIQVMDQYLAILETRIRLVPVDCRPVEPEAGTETSDFREQPPVNPAPKNPNAFVPSVYPAQASGAEIPSDVVHEKNVPTEGTGKPVKLWDLPPPTYSLTDQDFELLRIWVAGQLPGQVPLSPAELERLREPIVLIKFADAIGLRVMSSEDFAAVKSLIAKSRLELSTPMADTAARVLSHLGDAKVLLDAWTPPGR